MDKLLIIGSSGLVGSKIASLASKHKFEAHNTHHTRKPILPDSVDLDITDRKATVELVERIRPKAIVNTAAVTNVDYCETHKEEAKKVNSEGVKNVAEAARENQCRLVQVSTDYVFDGSVGHYTESDAPNPLQYYGQTKLEAEKIVSNLPSFAIARPSVIYGWVPTNSTETKSGSAKAMNFAMFVLDKLKANETVNAIRDLYASPTFSDNLAAALLRLAKSRENGLFHTSGRSCMSRYEFAVKVADIFGYPSRLIKPVFASELKQQAKRPPNSCLRVEKAEITLGMRFLNAEEGIAEMKKQDQFRVISSG